MAIKNFEFKQLLRAFRMGIIDEATFEAEMKHLENGHSSNGASAGSFTAFGKTYASEHEAVMKFLETVSAAETNGGDTVRAWLEVCSTDCIRGGLKMVAERESYHGRAFAIRPLFEFAASLKDDLMTKEMAQLFAEDELSTLKWQKAAWEALKPKTESAQASASA
jgi:hypothetical protein